MCKDQKKDQLDDSIKDFETIVDATKNMGATAFRCHRNKTTGFIDCSFKIDGMYIPMCNLSVLEYANMTKPEKKKADASEYNKEK